MSLLQLAARWFLCKLQPTYLLPFLSPHNVRVCASLLLPAHLLAAQSDIKKGVRSQSVASTMFSRLKKAGQCVKSMAASLAGSNNSGGGKSGKGGGLVGAFSWRPGAGRSKGGGTSSNDSGD